MPRQSRIVIPGLTHHITQRGNYRLSVFDKDTKVDILSYCLMPNHTHLIAIPHKDGNLAQAIADTHRNYTRFINFREKWRGYLWQGMKDIY